MSMISYLTTIRFEFGAIKGIQQDLTELGISKPLIIADEGVAKAGLVAKITAVIEFRRRSARLHRHADEPDRRSR